MLLSPIPELVNGFLTSRRKSAREDENVDGETTLLDNESFICTLLTTNPPGGTGNASIVHLHTHAALATACEDRLQRF